MPYINVGARIDGARPRSKKALREALRDAPETVTFDSTSPLGQQFDGTGTQIPASVTLTVTGPDPYAARDWWASVTLGASGKVAMK